MSPYDDTEHLRRLQEAIGRVTSNTSRYQPATTTPAPSPKPTRNNETQQPARSLKDEKAVSLPKNPETTLQGSSGNQYMPRPFSTHPFPNSSSSFPESQAENTTPQRRASVQSVSENQSATSPLLLGITAPPPTPETRAMLKSNNMDLDDNEIVGYHLVNHLATKTSPGLGGSIHAPRRSSLLSKGAERPGLSPEPQEQQGGITVPRTVPADTGRFACGLGPSYDDTSLRSRIAFAPGTEATSSRRPAHKEKSDIDGFENITVDQAKPSNTSEGSAPPTDIGNLEEQLLIFKSILANKPFKSEAHEKVSCATTKSDLLEIPTPLSKADEPVRKISENDKVQKLEGTLNQNNVPKAERIVRSVSELMALGTSPCKPICMTGEWPKFWPWLSTDQGDQPSAPIMKAGKSRSESKARKPSVASKRASKPKPSKSRLIQKWTPGEEGYEAKEGTASEVAPRPKDSRQGHEIKEDDIGDTAPEFEDIQKDWEAEEDPTAPKQESDQEEYEAEQDITHPWTPEAKNTSFSSAIGQAFRNMKDMVTSLSPTKRVARDRKSGDDSKAASDIMDELDTMMGHDPTIPSFYNPSSNVFDDREKEIIENAMRNLSSTIFVGGRNKSKIEKQVKGEDTPSGEEKKLNSEHIVFPSEGSDIRLNGVCEEESKATTDNDPSTPIESNVNPLIVGTSYAQRAATSEAFNFQGAHSMEEAELYLALFETATAEFEEFKELLRQQVKQPSTSTALGTNPLDMKPVSGKPSDAAEKVAMEPPNVVSWSKNKPPLPATEASQRPKAATASISKHTGLIKEALEVPATVISAAAKSPTPVLYTPNESDGFFPIWPSTGKRSAPAARVRKVTITNIPAGKDPRFVASLVYGGPIESITMGLTSATVLFVDADDCMRFYQDTANGLVYGKDEKTGREQFVLVELGKEVDVLSSRLREAIDNGATRVVHAIGTDFELNVRDLAQSRSLKVLKMEHVVDEKHLKGSQLRRTVIFRFCNISDAITFLNWLKSDVDWECFNTRFGPDLCAGAKGIHFGD